MNHAFVGKWAVRYECQRSSITAGACVIVLTIIGSAFAALGMYAIGGTLLALAGGFFGAALMALRIERRFKES